MERLNKFLAQAGVASRRKCDQLIKEGKVTVDGRVVTSPGEKVRGEEIIKVENKIVEKKEELVYVELYKPRGYITTVCDPRGRPTVMELVPEITTRVFPVGRLDSESEGLLFLTNDGALSYFLTHPRFEVEKKYLVYVSGEINERELSVLKRGIIVKEIPYRIRQGKIRDVYSNCSIVEVVLIEGKKHEIRIMFDYLGYPVLRLIRVGMGPLSLDENLLPGEWRYLSSKEVQLLQKYQEEKLGK
ncbi:MAG TPA: pseudouridine synthase [Candidatus Atribacteria bacterium]|nr:pseudouridine synthase [Candidatus Atribacteria bacterium]